MRTECCNSSALSSGIPPWMFQLELPEKSLEVSAEFADASNGLAARMDDGIVSTGPNRSPKALNPPIGCYSPA
jgi:hypothetical protein